MCMLCLCGEDSTRLAAFSFFHLGRRLSLCQGLAAPPPQPWAMLRLAWACLWALEPVVIWKDYNFLCPVALHVVYGSVLRIEHVFIMVFFFSFPVRVLRGVLCLQCGRLGRFPSCSWFLTCPTIRTCVNTTDLLTVEGRFMVLIAPCMITKSV